MRHVIYLSFSGNEGCFDLLVTVSIAATIMGEQILFQVPVFCFCFPWFLCHFFKIDLYWSIIASQYHLSFCCTPE